MERALVCIGCVSIGFALGAAVRWLIWKWWGR